MLAKCQATCLKKGIGYSQRAYLAIENKKDDIDTPSLKEERKVEKQPDSPKEEKCGWGPNCPFCKAQDKQGEKSTAKALTKATSSETGQHDQDKTAMGSRNGETK